jgi:hypothetical protein
MNLNTAQKPNLGLDKGETMSAHINYEKVLHKKYPTDKSAQTWSNG